MAAEQRAVTATWIITVDSSTPGPGELHERMRDYPVDTICRWMRPAERSPVHVSVRPAADLRPHDAAYRAGPSARPVPADLYSGPTLIREALRRIAEADRAELMTRVGEQAEPITSGDGSEVEFVDAYSYAAHMRDTAAVLMVGADVASRLAPMFGERFEPDDAEWAAALSCVEALVPVPPEEQDEPEPEHKLASARIAGPGENGVECVCGVVYDGFDTPAEANAVLDEHIARAAGGAR